LKLAFIDVGELGWSIYITAHLRWLKQNSTFDSVAVITYPDRQCSYEGLADIILDVPKEFYEKFDIQKQECFGLKETPPETLLDFFKPFTPEGYYLSKYFLCHCVLPFGDRMIYEPYSYSKTTEDKNEILVFPRYRADKHFTRRNLPELFYMRLVEKLCDEFPHLTVRTVGITGGAYTLDVKRKNYINSVGNGTLQDLIGFCQVAICAMGGASAPPKIALLQGVPTFVVGHERVRLTMVENWMSTKVGFYDVLVGGYAGINVKDCIDKVVTFVRECQ